MADLIPSPDLDLRDEESLAAEAISRVTGSLTVTRIDEQTAYLRVLREQIMSGLEVPICPELANANPSAPHTVLLEVQSWLVAQLTRRINVLPVRDQIEFARLFGIELREASPATTILTFNVVNASPDVITIIPAETEVTSLDGVYVFKTDVELQILAGQFSGNVSATRNTSGVTILLPDMITVITSSFNRVISATNLSEIASGTDAETIEQALVRARNYQRRGERLVNAQDFEDAVRDEVLNNNGIVKAFPFIQNGDWENRAVGHTTIVVMTQTGAPVNDGVKQAINRLLSEVIGNQFIYVIDPTFVDFNIEAQISIGDLVSPSAVIAGVEKNLRDFYAARLAKFGVPALRSEIIAVIEGSVGVDRIVPNDGEILLEPATDIEIPPFYLSRLINATITIV